MRKPKARGFRFRKQTIVLLNKLAKRMKSEQDKVVYTALQMYEKKLEQLDNKEEITGQELAR